MTTKLEVIVTTPVSIDIESVYEVFEEIFNSTETEVNILAQEE